MDRQDIIETEALFSDVLRCSKVQWQRFAGHGLSRTAIGALYLLDQKGEQKAAELVERLQVTGGAVTSIFDKLIELGYADRSRDEADRRVVFMRITPEGRAFLQSLITERQRFVERLLIGLDDGDVGHMKRILGQILLNLKQQPMEKS